MAKLSFKLPWPPSVNHYWRNVGGRMLISSRGRAYKASARMLVRRPPEPLSEPIVLRIDCHRPDNRRRDLDNVLKALLDALTGAGVWADDSQIDIIHARLWPVPDDDEMRGIVCVTVLTGEDRERALDDGVLEGA